MKKILFLMLFLYLTASSCMVILNTKEFNELKNRSKNIKMLLKIDGYYYNEYCYNSSYCDSSKVLRPILFYEDGMVNVWTG